MNQWVNNDKLRVLFLFIIIYNSVINNNVNRIYNYVTKISETEINESLLSVINSVFFLQLKINISQFYFYRYYVHVDSWCPWIIHYRIIVKSEHLSRFRVQDYKMSVYFTECHIKVSRLFFRNDRKVFRVISCPWSEWIIWFPLMDAWRQRSPFRPCVPCLEKRNTCKKPYN